MNSDLDRIESYYLEKLRSDPLGKEVCSESDFESQVKLLQEAGATEDEANQVASMFQCRPFHQVYDYILDQIQAEVESAVRACNANLPGKVLLRTLPTGFANAGAVNAPGGYLVTVRAELFQVIYRVCKVFCHSLDFIMLESPSGSRPLSEIAGFAPSGWTQSQAISSLVEIYDSLVDKHTVYHAPRHEIPMGQRQAFLDQIVYFAELFAVSHEYAHVLHGHCDESLESISAVERFHNEFAADDLALTLLLAPADLRNENRDAALDANYRVAGACIMFCVQVLLEACRSTDENLGFKSRAGAEYPSPMERLVRMLNSVKQRYPDWITQFADAVMIWSAGVMPALIAEVRGADEIKWIAENAKLRSQDDA
ncbi:hypothetical protein FYK55_03665 [Roseiconus nitratireducens]|uniref:Uncharacterized protein n=1 Tax=Roseiconus nitratireducens TaxID=2605748 RepID=A0A5M6DKZ9_9BACT|nr:hypothetical protein [Roseiconus nitratireducens]KAA5546015.1 hypothetical protein FYK55_03665 [Roseiconus nitratireducens]